MLFPKDPRESMVPRPKSSTNFSSLRILLYVGISIIGYLLIAKSFAFVPFHEDETPRACDRLTIIGTLMDGHSGKTLQGVTEVNLGTLESDDELINGQFEITGFLIPENKIIDLSITYADNRMLKVEKIDLNNTQKYPIRDCIIDVQKIKIKIPESQSSLSKLTSPSGLDSKKLRESPPVKQKAVEDYIDITQNVSTAFLNSNPLQFTSFHQKIQSIFTTQGVPISNSFFLPTFSAEFGEKVSNFIPSVFSKKKFDQHLNCICQVKEKVEYESTELDDIPLWTARVQIDLIFFHLKNGQLPTITISESGLGASQAAALRNAEDRLVQSERLKMLPISQCK